MIDVQHVDILVAVVGLCRDTGATFNIKNNARIQGIPVHADHVLGVRRDQRSFRANDIYLSSFIQFLKIGARRVSIDKVIIIDDDAIFSGTDK